MSPATAPYFEDLRIGETEQTAPPLTLTAGHAALHQAIVGDRLRLPLDAALSAEVVGEGPPPAHPALVCDVAIGQSTMLTRRVIANLFYRGLRLLRAPRIGDTLTTSTEVVGLRQNRPRPGRPATGLAALRIRTVDQLGRPVLDFHRCAMLPLRDPTGSTGHADELSSVGADLVAADLAASVAGWRLDRLRAATPPPHFADLRPGESWAVEGGDVVSSAPELARLTLNVAAAHHDAGAAGGRRLVYGGHTIGVAAAHVARVLPALATIVAWHCCDHLGPVFEGDTLHSGIELERVEPLPSGGGLVHLRVRCEARREGGAASVLDWRPVGVMP